MTASELIGDAAVFCGLADPGETPANVLSIGLASLNRWYSRVWHDAPNARLRAGAWSVAVTAGQTDVVLPAEVDVVLAVIADGWPLDPLAPGQYRAGYRPMADAEGEDDALCRVIQLVPAAVADGTIEVYGHRRFTPLVVIEAVEGEEPVEAQDDPIPCERLAHMLFHYVCADFYLHMDEIESRKESLKAAAELKKEYHAQSVGLPEYEIVQLPEVSFL